MKNRSGLNCFSIKKMLNIRRSEKFTEKNYKIDYKNSKITKTFVKVVTITALFMTEKVLLKDHFNLVS